MRVRDQTWYDEMVNKIFSCSFLSPDNWLATGMKLKLKLEVEVEVV